MLKKFFIHSIAALCLLLLCNLNATATIYNAIASGNYTDASTWQGGNIPPRNPTGHSIIIPSGITVTVATKMFFTGSSASDELHVEGNLNMPGMELILFDAVLKGSGTITAGSFGGEFTRGFDFSGTITTGYLDGSTISANTNVVFNVADRMDVADSMQMDQGTLNIGPGCFIILHGVMARTTPTLKMQGSSTLSFGGNYSVAYTGDRLYTGKELSGQDIDSVIVAMNGNLQQVYLNEDLNIKGKLNILSGMLVLNGHDLNLAATSSFESGPTGSIKSSSPSNITIECATPLTGPLRFNANGHEVDDFTVNTTGVVVIENNLTVSKFDLVKGKIAISNGTLHIPTVTDRTLFSPDRYIITVPTGALGQAINPVNSNKDSAFYPIGTTTQYLPMKVVTTSQHSLLKANVSPGVPDGSPAGKDMALTRPVVNATWALNGDNAINGSMETTWYPAAEVNGFDKSNAYISWHNTINKWDKIPTKKATANADGSFSITRDNVTQMGYFAVFDKNTVSIQDMVTQQQIAMYPNPATSALYIDIKIEAQAMVYNTTGQLMQQATITPGNNTINTSALPAGMYYIQLQGGSVNATGSFIKQ